MSIPRRYWLIHPNGGRQLIDPAQFDLQRLAEQARLIGGRLVVESAEPYSPSPGVVASTPASDFSAASLPSARTSGSAPILATPVVRFEPPISALNPLFRHRLNQIYSCVCEFEIDINIRPTSHVLGGYYKTKRLVRVYSHDRALGRRPLEELFDTFLHEVAHHIEYTEPDSFHARSCGRVPGRMHSRLFWRILGELKGRWTDLQLRRS